MYKRLTLVALCVVLFAAIGASPRYLEELRIGGGYGEPADGGADFEKDGDILTNGNLTVAGGATLQGDLSVNGGDVFSSGTSVNLDPSGAGYVSAGEGVTQIQNNSGRLWFYATAGASSHFRFYMPDSASNMQDYGSLWCVATDTLEGSEDSTFKLALVRGAVYDYDVFSVSGLGHCRTDGDFNADGGDIVAGTDSATRGVLTLWDGSGGAAPGAIKIHSPNGTAWYLFVEDDGTLKVYNALPASNNDGTVVGLQY